MHIPNNLPTVILILSCVLACWLLFRRWLLLVIVYDYQAGLLYRNGRLVRLVPPGSYWLNKVFDKVEVVDLRLTTSTVGAQEVISQDNVGLKLSIAMRYKIDNAEKALHSTQSWFNDLYLLVQLACRDLVAATKADELLAKRKEIGESLLLAVQAEAAKFGIDVQSVEIKDIMFPNEIRKLFGELVRAQKEGQASLERARAEHATLRSLANAARMIEGNPALMNLRVLHSLSATTNSGTAPSLVLGVPQGMFPLAQGEKPNLPAPETNE